MKQKIILFLALCGLLVSCSDSEDTSPSYADQNLFAPSDDDHSETAQIERDFYKNNGCYLLFNDTLKSEQNGVDAYGNPIWKHQLIDVGYPVIGDMGASYEYTYKYVTDTELQKKAADLVSSKIAKVLGKGSPYSILVVDSIYTWTYSDGRRQLATVSSWSDELLVNKYLNGTRCIAVCLWNGEAFKDDSYFQDVIQDVVYSKLSHIDQAKLKEFYSTGLPYYQAYKGDLGYPYVVDDDLARSLGFWADYNAYFLALKSDDLRKFSDAVCTYSLEEVQEMMQDYPLVIKRFEMIRNILLSLGINLK